MHARHLLRIAAATVTTLFCFVAISLAQNSQQAQKGWPSYGHDPQHTAVSARGSQSIAKIHWSTPVETDAPGGGVFSHFGSPLVTAANTTIISVDVGSGFRVDARNGQTGSLVWSQNTDYIAPGADFAPGMYPVLDHNRVVIPAGGGTILVRGTPDQPTGSVSRVAFYGIDNYNQNPGLYNQRVQISTPITADSQGNIYFGFIVSGPTPINLQSGIARISITKQGTWISAASATNDPSLSQPAISCGPALSPDESTVYIALTDPDFGSGDLVSFDSQTLATKNYVELKDPSSGEDAIIYDASSASPTVGPDGDVYYGVLENPFPDHNDRGWLLHFDATLTQSKIPGSFGWDDTASIVDASLVSSYQGTSKYLLMSKYNNYAGIGSGDGVNKIAVLDPNDTEPDPILPPTPVMKEILTIKGVTRDPNFPQYPHAVREWCINTAAVDPVTKTILANSEDGKLYRWDLTTNTFTQRITLSSGVGEAYTPTVIGTDGTVYGINDAVLFALGK